MSCGIVLVKFQFEEMLVLIMIHIYRGEFNNVGACGCWIYRCQALHISKTCLKWPLKNKDQKLIFKTDYRLMQVKSIAECSTYPSVNMPWNLLFLPRIPWISNKFAMDF